MILDDVTTDVSSQLDAQSELGVQITRQNEVPETGPTARGLWFRIPEVTAVFADLKGSTQLNAENRQKEAARAYTYFIRAMAIILNRFGSKYVDIQGDGIFGLFSGKGSRFFAASCAITMRTLVEKDVAVRFENETETDWELTAGIGIDHGTLLVRRLGLRRTKENEVWAGKPVNMAAKLSSLAESNQVVVSDRVFQQYEGASELRRQALIWSCGCSQWTQGTGLDTNIPWTPRLWNRAYPPYNSGLDFNSIYKRDAAWCEVHGAEFCEAIVTDRRPDG